MKPGDTIKVTLTDTKEVHGILMPRPELFGEDKIVLKLSSGYNIGVEKKNIKEIIIEKEYRAEEKKKTALQQNPDLKKITILHSGGTIASQVDYKTGGVVAKYDPQEFLQLFPELHELVQIDSVMVSQVFSEDMEPEHWKKLAEAVEKEYKKGAKGIIITHGTDTMHYTSAALTFMLQNLPIPVLLVGSQRSPDRGSSDAYQNLLHAVQFIAGTEWIGVGICMHGSTDDDCSYIHCGTKVKKMHTSRRDTFTSINTTPLAKVSAGKIDYLREHSKTVSGKFHVLSKFKKAGLLKAHPGMIIDELKFFADNNYDGLIIEGTGLGHLPVNATDEHTKHHAELLELLKKMSTSMVIVMCSQCSYGAVDLDVYATGRYLAQAGVISGKDMTSETAYVKLSWLLGNYTFKQAKEMISQDIAGEISDRQQYQEL